MLLGVFVKKLTLRRWGGADEEVVAEFKQSLRTIASLPHNYHTSEKLLSVESFPAGQWIREDIPEFIVAQVFCIYYPSVETHNDPLQQS